MLPPSPLFLDRRDAGRQLAAALLPWKDRQPIILALPRGGVPVAFEIAHALDAPLDLLLVRKIGAPHFEELALGAVVGGASPQRILNTALIERLRTPQEWLENEEQRQLVEIERRRDRYLDGRAPLPVDGRTVIVVDDGIATGATMRVALAALAQSGAARRIAAVPVAPPDTLEQVRLEADACVCLQSPEDFQAVGFYYRDFAQTGDEEVVALLAAAANARASQCSAEQEAGHEKHF